VIKNDVFLKRAIRDSTNPAASADPAHKGNCHTGAPAKLLQLAECSCKKKKLQFSAAVATVRSSLRRMFCRDRGVRWQLVENTALHWAVPVPYKINLPSWQSRLSELCLRETVAGAFLCFKQNLAPYLFSAPLNPDGYSTDGPP